MKKKFLKENIMDSYVLFVYDCGLTELHEFILKEFHYKMELEDGIHGGKFITINNEKKGTTNHIIWAVNDVSLAHEIIHLVASIFEFHEMTLCNENEEVFCRLHSYYYDKCLKLLRSNNTNNFNLLNNK